MAGKDNARFNCFIEYVRVCLRLEYSFNPHLKHPFGKNNKQKNIFSCLGQLQFRLIFFPNWLHFSVLFYTFDCGMRGEKRLERTNPRNDPRQIHIHTHTHKEEVLEWDAANLLKRCFISILPGRARRNG